LYLEAYGKYTKFHQVNHSPIISSYTLKHFSNQLPSDLFIRINHGYIINLLHLQYIDKTDDFNAVITGDIRLPISYRKKGDVFYHLTKSGFIHSDT